ncbi:MAG: hypothetical protein CVT59_02765 [Actinobacteria bacterium HGW-Actinobacteria-1]|jgi:three-Cys-motif partner protein|nr:MAG: hypothetical protein CVT59_02765 [Actinobacteria bacterium HGW-Actinobacteria-1]
MGAEDSYLFEDDGLILPPVGAWTREKHQKVAYYSSLFSTSMKNAWDCRVYVELFAGAGKSRIRETDEVIPGSPLLALGMTDPYDKYVFCEHNPEHMAALQARIGHQFADRDVTYVAGDVNDSVDRLLATLPQFSKDYRGLTLCFVDPYKMSQLSFSTMSQLAASLYVDFLVLVPTYMDIHRNLPTYARRDCPTLDNYLGTDRWRAKWDDMTRRKSDFGLFVADELGLQMKTMGFLYDGIGDFELVRMGSDNHLPLYHLAFFSKSALGLRFWRETRKNTSQPRLFPLD